MSDTQLPIEDLLSLHWHKLFSPEELFKHLDIYQSTPLKNIADLASLMQLGGLMVKDERNRLGLGSFKSIGGVYAVACILQAIIQQRDNASIQPEALFSERAKSIAANLTFSCATAGNHGVAVAKAAQLFGAKAVVYLSRQVSDKFEKKLLACGAEVRRAGDDYQQSLSAAEQASQEQGMILVSHNSWRGNRRVPQLIMRGYQLIAAEIQQDIACADGASPQWPDYIFLHGGARGLAMGVAKAIRCSWPVQPQIIVVECDFSEPVSQAISPQDELAQKQSAFLAYEYLSEQANHFYSITPKEAESATAILRDYGLDVSSSEAVGFAGIKSVVDQQGQLNWSVGKDDRCLFLVSELD